MELFKLFGKIGVDNKDANSKIDGTASKAQAASGRMQTAFQNIGSSIRNNFNPQGLQDFGARVQNVGQNVSSVGSTLTSKLTLPIVGATAAAGGLVAALGWKRLVSIDSAQGQLRGLGYETEDVNRITDNLVLALEGGMLTMGQATSAAASGLAAGVKEGDELTRYIKLLDAATAGSNGTFDEMNQIFSRIQGSGKLMTTELDMMEQRMPGFSAAMADGFGVTQEEMRKMVSNGEVSAGDFMDVMEDFGGDMATEYAKTWEGMVQNTLAYIGILGQALLGGVFEQSKESIAQFLAYLASDEVQTWAAEAGVAIGNAFTQILEWVQRAIEWWGNLDTSQKQLVAGLIAFAAAIGPILIVVGKLITLAGTLIAGFGRAWGILNKVRAVFGLTAVSGGQLVGMLARFLGPIGLVASAFMLLWQNSETFREGMKAIWETITSQLEPVFERISGELIPKVREAFTSIMTALAPVGEFLMNVFVAVFQFVFPLIVTLVQGAITNVINVIDGLVTFISGVVDLIAGIFTGDWARAWEGLKQIVSGAVKAVWNLIQLWFLGRVIGIVRSLGTGLLSLFRGMWTSIRSFIGTAVNGIFNVIRSIFTKVRSFLNGLMNGIKTLFSVAWAAIQYTIRFAVNAVFSVIRSVFTNVRSFLSSIWNGIRSTISNAVNAIRSTVSTWARSILTMISSAMRSVRSTIASVWSNIRSTMGNAANGARNLVVNAFNALRSGAVNAITSLLSTVRGIPGRIRSALGNAGTMLLNAGRSIINGLVNGIKGSISKVTGAVSNVMQAARNLLPFSPAKEGPFSGKGWSLYSGQAITESIGEGMEDEKSSMLSKARDVMGALKSEMDPTLTATADVTANAGAMHQNFMSRASDKPDPLEAKVDKMVDLLTGILNKSGDVTMDGKSVAALISPHVNNNLGTIKTQNARGAR